MKRPPRPNWLLKTGLGIVSAAIAAIGVFGWLYRAGVFDAVGQLKASLLSPLWPFYAAAAVGCLASQIVVACCGANFHLHSWTRAPLTRCILILGILVFASFATVGAENGWMIATGAGQREASQARTAERKALADEIRDLTRKVDDERAKLPDPTTTPALRQSQARDTFLAATRDASARLPQARAELQARPALTDDRERTGWDWLMMLAFLAYQLLEPWLYYAAEQGRHPAETPARTPQPIPKPTPKLTETLTPTMRESRTVATVTQMRRRPTIAEGSGSIYAHLDRIAEGR